MRHNLLSTIALSAFLFLPRFLLAQAITFDGCTVDAEIWAIPACAIEHRGTELFIRQRYLHVYTFGGPYHYAWAELPEGDWGYFDRSGHVVVRNVAMFDNGPSDFHHGLVRVVKNGKWGLSDPKGHITAPLTYDGIGEPKPTDKNWFVCVGCRTERKGEYSFWVGGIWSNLNWQGKLIVPSTSKTEVH